MYKWYLVNFNGGKTAVKAKTEQEAINLYNNSCGYLATLPGTTATETTENEALNNWRVIR